MFRSVIQDALVPPLKISPYTFHAHPTLACSTVLRVTPFRASTWPACSDPMSTRVSTIPCEPPPSVMP